MPGDDVIPTCLSLDEFETRTISICKGKDKNICHTDKLFLMLAQDKKKNWNNAGLGVSQFWVWMLHLVLQNCVTRGKWIVFY